ncbi:dihydrouridine synthase, putative [Plasmodium vinckei brucechwatti]|uniref:Dihydrouridine synthase, putative n=1 Tax=Plasmodium vinckei brucechwatti TaxID=119398 RepID=A0A6V7S3V4_PLAVN|nr:dihydrouridine synthase, putative [Plasmodium vinckei brucechwatti]
MRNILVKGLILYMYFTYFKNHGNAKLNKNKYTLIRVYHKNHFKLYKKKKIEYSKDNIDSKINYNRHTKINTDLNLFKSCTPFGKNNRGVFFIANNINTKDKIKNLKRKNMSILSSNNINEALGGVDQPIFELENISQSLNDLYRKRKSEIEPLIQVAPMINVTNRHFRALVRIISKKVQLWTEMIVDNTLLYNINNLEEHLGFNKNEHPIVCQLGGSDPTSLSEAAVLVEQAGYDEININVGCPSTKVANKGAFGAYLMKKPELVKNIVYEIKKKVQIPVTVKIRTGVDDLDSFSFLRSFIETVSSVGCEHFIIHSRKAWLKGLDPKQNRSVPPLEYNKVFDLCKLYPNLKFTLNGGIKSIEQGVALLNGYAPINKTTGNHNNYTDNNYIKVEDYDINPLYGVMIGRACMDNITVLAKTDKLVYNHDTLATAYSRRTVLEAYKSYLEQNSSFYSLVNAFELLKPILGILKGMPGHRLFRNKIDSYIRTYASTLNCAQILDKAMVDVDNIAPGCLDLMLDDYKAQQEYIKNY